MKLLVCNHHVSIGIKEMSVPHVNKMSSDRKEECFYCNRKAKIKLYVPYKCVSRQNKLRLNDGTYKNYFNY